MVIRITQVFVAAFDVRLPLCTCVYNVYICNDLLKTDNVPDIRMQQEQAVSSSPWSAQVICYTDNVHIYLNLGMYVCGYVLVMNASIYPHACSASRWFPSSG